MKLACTDFTFPRLPHSAALELIRAMGFDGVDICLVADRSHLTARSVHTDPVKAGAALRAELDPRGLVVSDVLFVPSVDYSAIAVNHASAEARSEWGRLFASALTFAGEVGAHGMTILPGPSWADEPREALLDRSIDELRIRFEEADAAGLPLSVEPHLGSYMESPSDVLAAVERFDDIRITLDYAHFVYEGFAEESIHPLVQHARHIHLRGARRGRLQSSMSDNTIDFAAIVDHAVKTSFSGYYSCEYVWFKGEGAYSHCDECDCISETSLLSEVVQEAYASA